MSGVGQSEDGVEASTSGMMETTMMEGEEYYNPDDTGTWAQKEMSDQLCRICAKPNQYLIPIFEGEGIEHQLEPKIQKHLPIEVSESDDLPLQVCYQCASTLIAWNDLVIACIEADKKLRQMHEQEEEDEDDKGAEFFDEPILDSDEGEEPVQPSTSIATVASDMQSDATSQPKRSPGKAKKPKLKMTLVKSPTAGPSGLKIPLKRVASKPKEDAGQEVTERFPQTLRSFQNVSTKYQWTKKPPLYFVCDICFQPFKTEWDVLSHKKEDHNRTYCTEEHLDMPVEVNIKEQDEVIQHDGLNENNVNNSMIQPGINIGKIETEPHSSSEEEEEEEEQQRSNSKSSCGSYSEGFRTKYEVQQQRTQNHGENEEALAQIDPEPSDEELYNLKAGSRKINPKYPRLFPCDLCGKSFTRNYDMHKHRKQQHPEATELILEEDLKLLNYSEHGNSYQSEHVRETTEEEGVKLTIKRRVRKTYEKEEEEKISKARVIVDGVKFFHCDICNHHLKSKYSFVTHLRIHSGEKPFTCHICGRQFRVWEQLQRHVSDVHDKIKNYECHICGRKFATVNTRNEHLFTHSQDRSFVCHMCGKAFRSNGTLRVHYKFHTDIFPHQCPHCDKRFRMRQHFDNHLRVHTGEKPHACTVCGKHFRTKWCVKKHTLIHTSTETFECVVCRKNYSQKRYLRNHMRLSHGVRFTGNRMTN